MLKYNYYNAKSSKIYPLYLRYLANVMNKIKSLLPKGFRDFNIEVMRKRNFIFQTVQSVFECYGYSQIQTPAIEDITCLTGNYGDEGDRLIFKILNSGDFLKKLILKIQ